MHYERPATAPPRPLDRLHAALSRVTSSGRYDAAVDGLRFVSILGVLLFHVGVWPDHVGRAAGGVVEDVLVRTASIGRFGVQTFFAISGLILARPFAEALKERRSAPRLRDYYIRRVSRIEPPYLICMLALFALQGVRRAVDARDAVGWDSLASVLTYTHSAVYGTNNPIDPVTWSLEVEVRFYLIAPLVFLALFRMPPTARRWTLAAVAVAWAVWAAPLDTWAGAGEASLAAQAGWFLAGMFVADAETSPTDAARGSPLIWDIAATAAAAAIWFLVQREGIAAWDGAARAAGTFLGPTCVAVFFLGVLRGDLWRGALSNRWISVVGGMCYSIYLWHFPLMRLVQARLGWTLTGDFLVDYAKQAAVLVPSAVVAGAAMFVVTEKPFMRRDWPRRLVALLRPAAT